jgi:hypothetical protein
VFHGLKKETSTKLTLFFFTKQLSLTFSFQKNKSTWDDTALLWRLTYSKIWRCINQNTTQRMSQPQANRGFTIETPPPFEKAPADATHWSVTVSLNSKYRETSGQPRATSLFTKIPLVYSTTKMESNLIQHNGWVNPTPIWIRWNLSLKHYMTTVARTTEELTIFLSPLLCLPNTQSHCTLFDQF